MVVFRRAHSNTVPVVQRGYGPPLLLPSLALRERTPMAHGPQLGDAVREPAGLLEPLLWDVCTVHNRGCARTAHHQLSGAARAVYGVPRDGTARCEQSVSLTFQVHLQLAFGQHTVTDSDTQARTRARTTAVRTYHTHIVRTHAHTDGSTAHGQHSTDCYGY